MSQLFSHQVAIHYGNMLIDHDMLFNLELHVFYDLWFYARMANYDSSKTLDKLTNAGKCMISALFFNVLCSDQSLRTVTLFLNSQLY